MEKWWESCGKVIDKLWKSYGNVMGDEKVMETLKMWKKVIDKL